MGDNAVLDAGCTHIFTLEIQPGVCSGEQDPALGGAHNNLLTSEPQPSDRLGRWYPIAESWLQIQAAGARENHQGQPCPHLSLVKALLQVTGKGPNWSRSAAQTFLRAVQHIC